MPLTMTTAARNCPFFIVLGDAEGKPGAPLPPDTTIKVTSEPANLAVLSLDPNPVPISSPLDAHVGLRSVASGEIRPLAAGTVTVTASVVGADDKSLGTATDTLTIVEKSDKPTPEWEGELFGSKAPLALSA